EDGNIGGWAFSIDTFGLHFLFNHLVGAGFQGLVHVPIFKADCEDSDEEDIEPEDCFNYSAQFVNGNELQFAVSPKTQMCVSIWSAHVVLDSNTIVNLRKTSNDFFLEAILCGKAYFGDSTNINDSTIWFQNVRLRNKAPYFSPGFWHIPNISVNLGVFAMSISQIVLDTVPQELNKSRLSFVAGVEINTKYKLKAQGSLSILGDLVVVSGRQRWVYEKIKINGL